MTMITSDGSVFCKLFALLFHQFLLIPRQSKSKKLSKLKGVFAQIQDSSKLKDVSAKLKVLKIVLSCKFGKKSLLITA